MTQLSKKGSQAMSKQPTPIQCWVVGATLCLSLVACSTAKVVSSQDIAPAISTPHQAIYVADFELHASDIKTRQHLLHLPRLLSRNESQPEHTVTLMSNSIIADLAKQGIEAYRLPPGTPMPGSGWLVHGAFLELDEGDRLRRAVIGFGAGQVNIEVAAAIDNLSAQNAPAPIYELQTDATSGKFPGAVVTLNPYVAAFKFVLAGHDVDHETEKTAAQIADRVAAHLKATTH